MNLFIDLDSTLIFKDNDNDVYNSMSNKKVYIDLLERENEKLGVICNKTLSILKSFCDSKNKLIVLSNRDKESFDNINLYAHGINSYLDVLSFGYDIYKKGELQLIWLNFINERCYIHKKDLDMFHNFINEELPQSLLNEKSYGYLLKKDELLDDYDFINYEYLKYYLHKYDIVNVFEDDLNIYLVMNLFSNNELFDFIQFTYLLDEISCVVCSNESFYIDLMLKFKSNGIINFNIEKNTDFEEYLLINNYNDLLKSLISENVYIMNGNEFNTGEEVMYKVFEIFIDSL